MQVDIYGLHNALERVVAICRWLGTNVGVIPPPPTGAKMYFGHFLSFSLTGLYSPRVATTQVELDFPR